MGRFNWGADGPPDEAYSRVSDPERFAPLWRFALGLADRLEAAYLVDRVDLEEPTFGGLPGGGVGRAGLLLEPRSASAAPIEFAFSRFPGVYVRSGRSRVEAFPNCGCDACDETAEDEAERLEWEVTQVVAGRFLEGPARAYELWDGVGNATASRDLTGSADPALRWDPWELR